MSQSGVVLHIGPGDQAGEQRYLVVNFSTNTAYVLEVQRTGQLNQKDRHQFPDVPGKDAGSN